MTRHVTPEATEAAPSESEEGAAWETRDYGRLGPRVWIFGGLMVAIGIVTSVLMLRDFESESYLYLVFYAIPANTAISVFPHEPVLVYFGKVANIWISAAAATVGTVAAGYMDHAVFTPVLNLEGRQAYKEKKLYRKAVGFFERWPFATLVVAGATPVPFWPFKFLTFSAHYPLRRYLAALVVGRFPRYVILAWLGLTLGDAIPNWLLIALFVGILLTYAVNAAPKVWSRWRRRRDGGVTEEDRARSPAAAGEGGETERGGDGPGRAAGEGDETATDERTGGRG